MNTIPNFVPTQEREQTTYDWWDTYYKAGTYWTIIGTTDRNGSAKCFVTVLEYYSPKKVAPVYEYNKVFSNHKQMYKWIKQKRRVLEEKDQLITATRKEGLI